MGYILSMKGFRPCEICGFILLLTVASSGVQTQHLDFLINRSYAEEACFRFPPNWHTASGSPTDASVHLTECRRRERIRINKAEFIRPNDRGDECQGTAACCLATDDDCRLDLNEGYPTLYQDISNACNDKSVCSFPVSSVKMDSECGGTFLYWCDTEPGSEVQIDKSCFARRIKIYYGCLPPIGPEPMTKFMTVPSTKNPVATDGVLSGSTEPGAPATDSVVQDVTEKQAEDDNTGVIVGLALAAFLTVVVVVTVLVVVLMKRKRSKRKKPTFPPTQNGNRPRSVQEAGEPEYANQISRWDEAPADNEDNSLLNAGTDEQNDTYDNVKGKPTSIDYMLMTDVKGKKNKSNEEKAKALYAQPDKAKGAVDALATPDNGEIDYIRCDSLTDIKTKGDAGMDTNKIGQKDGTGKDENDTKHAENDKDRTYYNQLDLKHQRKPLEKATSVQKMVDNNVYESTGMNDPDEDVYETEKAVGIMGNESDKSAGSDDSANKNRLGDEKKSSGGRDASVSSESPKDLEKIPEGSADEKEESTNEKGDEPHYANVCDHFVKEGQQRQV